MKQVKIKKLSEAVTENKYKKMLKEISSCDKKKQRLQELNFGDDVAVEAYIKEELGKPKGLWKNTFDEQKKVLKRVHSVVFGAKADDVAIRPVAQPIN